MNGPAQSVRGGAFTTAGIEARFGCGFRTVNPFLPEGVKRFAEAWIGLALGDRRAEHLIDSKLAHQLITEREGQLKGARARLSSQAHLDFVGWRIGYLRH